MAISKKVAIPFDPGQVSTVIKGIIKEVVTLKEVAIPFDPGQVSTLKREFFGLDC